MILVQSLSKVYQLYRRPSDRILEMLPFFPRDYHKEFWALRDIDLEVRRGETFAVVGPNGSGKSTLLQIVAGIVQPTRGRVSTEGRIAALLELGAGFNPEFTGRENVFLNGEIMGLSRAQVEEVFPSIVAFAEIGEFMDRPVKEYSSGMYVRLAFSTAIHVDPDILIVDEALAVGDAIFSNRCIQKFEELKRKDVTILFVSHDLGLVKQLADRAVFLLNGRVEAAGKPSDVVNRYVGAVLERGRREGSVGDAKPPVESSFRHGDGASRIRNVELLNAAGTPTKAVSSGERTTIRVRAKFDAAVDNPVIGILIRNRLGIDVYGTNTRIEKQTLGSFAAGEELRIDFAFDCFLTRQEYTLTVATQNWDGTSQDWLDDVVQFTVVDTKDTAGVVSLGTEITWQKR
ncbi:MAG: ABC transporter ATP-binding protein [bacterium]|nr:ABC transporter ATP-binding protein [bacterium]